MVTFTLRNGVLGSGLGGVTISLRSEVGHRVLTIVKGVSTPWLERRSKRGQGGRERASSEGGRGSHDTCP